MIPNRLPVGVCVEPAGGDTVGVAVETPTGVPVGDTVVRKGTTINVKCIHLFLS